MTKATGTSWAAGWERQQADSDFQGTLAGTWQVKDTAG